MEVHSFMSESVWILSKNVVGFYSNGIASGLLYFTSWILTKSSGMYFCEIEFFDSLQFVSLKKWL